MLLGCGDEEHEVRCSSELSVLFILEGTEIIHIFFYQRREMFSLCGIFRSRKSHVDRKSPHYDQIQKALSEEEQAMLELIYTDLAARNRDNLLSYQNFLLFFGLAGLWGAKLFRQFDEDGRKLISKEEFFYGLSRTAKAPNSKKVELLFNFFKDDKDNGIKFNSFTKMLYNYSRDELKQILMEDLSKSPQLSKQISKKRSIVDPGSESSADLIRQPLLRSTRANTHKQETVIEVNYEELEAEKEDLTSFSRHYAEFNQYNDPGTILELKMNEFTYKINYCNMITLLKEFSKNVYKDYNIDIKNGIFTYEQFDTWIRAHPKLFQSYYTNFHASIWSYYDGEPNFLSKIDTSFSAKLSDCHKIKNIYGMMVGDILIIADSFNSRKIPTRVICLDGLNMTELRDEHGFGIELHHRDDYYPRLVIYFEKKDEMEIILECFQVFEGDTLYDLYDVHEMIGTGKFSIVYRCTDKETGKSYALKDISTVKLDPQAIAIFENESEIMKLLKHPQIVRYNNTIRSKEHVYIIAQYIYGKDLFEYVRKRKKLSQFVSAFIIGKIIEAVRYLHSLEIIHRDLKPENIMVMLKKKGSSNLLGSEHMSQEGIQNIKIIDFGLANHQSELDKSNQPHGLAGTPNYIAPEIILHNKASCKSDIFSIGSILYFLLSGKLAFSYKNVEYTLLRSAKGEYDFAGDTWTNITPEAKDLVSRLLEPDPEKRIDLDQALNHKWFEIAKENKGEGFQTEVSWQSDSDKYSKGSSNGGGFNSLREKDIEIMLDEVGDKRSKGISQWV